MATASHELRNPLNGVISMLQIIEQYIKNDPVCMQYWNVALNSSNLLLCLVNDILDYSKIEAGKLSLFYNSFSPEKIVKEIIQLLEF
jgi:signal transduction histidine kinase